MFNIRELIQEKKILFFGGKGGVGKTTLSAAAALLAANNDQKVLLVSTDPAHNLGHLLNQPIGSAVVAVAKNLDVLELDPEETVKQHLSETSNVLRQLMPIQLASEVDKHIELSRHAPGMLEAAMLERIAQVVIDSSRDYDLVIFDTAPSGHTAQLMALPEMMTAWTDGLLKRREKSEKLSKKINKLTNYGENEKDMGENIFGSRTKTEESNLSEKTQQRDDKIRSILNRRREKISDLRSHLTDKKNTAFVIVLAAERMPVLETIELYQQLKDMKISVAGAIINKRLPESYNEIADVFLNERKAQESIHLKTLSKSLPKTPTLSIPLSKHDVIGLDALAEFSEQL
ncbi:MAG: ArsA family ATPase [Cellvibrionaceae bacterium]